MSNGKSEEMLTQLIGMVGTLHADIKEIKEEVHELKEKVNELKGEVTELKGEVQDLKVEFHEYKDRQIQFEQKSEERHEELLRTIHSIKADQDYIWQKAVRNEREIEKLKNK